MSSATEFYDYARERIGWARTARSERERAIFVEMAQTWLAAAARVEAGRGELTEKNVASGGARMDGPDGRRTPKPEFVSNDRNPNQ